MWGANVILTGVGLLLLARMGREGATSRGGDLTEFVEGFKTMVAKLTRRGTMVAAERQQRSA